MQLRQQTVERRMRSALFREALDNTHEQYNLLLYLDTEFERRKLESEIAQWNSSCDNEGISNKPSPSQFPLVMDWEYNSWEDERYEHILSPKVIEQKEEQIETEIDIKRLF